MRWILLQRGFSVSVTAREEHKLRVFEDRVLRRIFGPKWDGVTGGWRKLHNEELHNLYSWPSIFRIIKSRRMRWAGHVARMEEKRNVCKLLIGKPEGKRQLGIRFEVFTAVTMKNGVFRDVTPSGTCKNKIHTA
jgi:hypothetical protein